MTCTAALIDNGTVYMGGDSICVCGWDITPMKEPKVFIKGKMAFGFTGDFRQNDLVKYQLEIPKHPKGMSNTRYIKTLFVEALRACYKAGGYAEIEDNVEKGGYVLIGYKGGIYNIQRNYQIIIPGESYYAIGCGEPYAIASLYTTRVLWDNEPRLRIKRALETAEHYSAGVRRPFTIIKLKG